MGGKNENSLYSCLCWKMGGTMHHPRTFEGTLCYIRGGTGEKGGGGISRNVRSYIRVRGVGIRVTAWIGWMILWITWTKQNLKLGGTGWW